MTADDVRARFEACDPKLDSPARVGSTTFGKGVSWSTVIGAAQRAYEYRDEPKLTAEQIAAFYIAFPHLAPDPEKVRAAHADLSVEVRELRRLLAVRVAGAMLYTDDGELSDASVAPHIDFLRDSAAEIARKLRDRAKFTQERTNG